MLDPMKSTICRRCASVALALGGLLFLAVAILLFSTGQLFPQERIRELIAAHSNMAGAAFFTADYYAGVVVRAKFAGAFCLVSALGLVGLWTWAMRRDPVVWSDLCRADRWTAGFRHMGREWTADWMGWAILAAAIASRIPFLFQPASSDEVQNYYAWTARPFLLAISDYRLPCNHLLYTLLDFPIVRILGNAEWAIRLPAFAAGILLPVLIYRAGRKWFGRNAGLLGACLMLTNPVFVHFSVNGRAYTLHACLVLVLWLAATRLAERPSWPSWLTLVLSGAAGLMALPTMAYPLAGTYLWLLAMYGTARGEIGGRRWRHVRNLCVCGAATIWLGALAYLPAYVASDQWYSLDGAEVAAALPWGMLPLRLTQFMKGAFWLWNTNLPTPVVWTQFAFAAVGVVGLWRTRGLHLLVFNVLGLLGVFVILRIVPYSRLGLYLGTAYLLVAGGGLAVAVERIWPAPGNMRATGILAVGLAILLGLNLWNRNRDGFTTIGLLSPGVRDLIVDLEPHVAAGDNVICNRVTAGPFYYYHLRHGMKARLWLIPDEVLPADMMSSDREVFIVADLYRGETWQNVLEAASWPPELIAQQRFALVCSNRYAAAYRRE